MQNQQLFNEKTSFLFQILLRFYAVNEENFHSDLRATYTKQTLQKLMQKTSFPSYCCNKSILNPRRKMKQKIVFYFVVKSHNKEK
jgi:hypothetical protein